MRYQRGFTLIELMVVIAIIAILAALAVSNYRNYTIRTQIADGLSLSAGVKASVMEYLLINNACPINATTAVAGIAKSTDITSKYVSSISVRNGSIGGGGTTMHGCDINITFSVNANRLLWERTLRLRIYIIDPSNNGARGSVETNCQGVSIPQEFLPSACESVSG